MASQKTSHKTRRGAAIGILGAALALNACAHAPLGVQTPADSAAPQTPASGDTAASASAAQASPEAHGAVCTGTLSETKGGHAPVAVQLTIDGANKVLKAVVGGQSADLPIDYANFNRSAQSLTVVTRGVLAGDPDAKDWLERMRRLSITVQMGDRELTYGAGSTGGFYVGDGESGMGGPLTCTDWRAAIPQNNFGE